MYGGGGCKGRGRDGLRTGLSTVERNGGAGGGASVCMHACAHVCPHARTHARPPPALHASSKSGAPCATARLLTSPTPSNMALRLKKRAALHAETCGAFPRPPLPSSTSSDQSHPLPPTHVRHSPARSPLQPHPLHHRPRHAQECAHVQADRPQVQGQCEGLEERTGRCLLSGQPGWPGRGGGERGRGARCTMRVRAAALFRWRGRPWESSRPGAQVLSSRTCCPRP